MTQTFTGCLIDNRSEADKAKDYKHEELFASGSVDWQERKPKAYPVRNQDGSSSCVAQSLALMLGIMNEQEEGKFIELSAGHIYNKRQNKNSGGMIGVDALEIARKFGATLEHLLPSQNMGEQVINSLTWKESDEQIGQVFRVENYIQLPFDIDRIADVLSTGKPVMTWFMFPRAEWTSKPRVTSSQTDMVHHSVTAIDFVLQDGKKYIVVQDSWGLDKTTDKGLRYISEDYIKNRMTFCAYLIDLPNNWRDTGVQIIKPRVKLSQTLKIGSRGDEVKQLQQVLKYEELFPQNATQDGIFGSVTDKGVRQFQTKHGLISDGIVGSATRSKINSLYK